jgi:hypothetical protein
VKGFDVGFWRNSAATVAVAAALCAVVASGESNSAEKVGDTSSGAKPAAAEKSASAPKTFKVGDKVKLGDYVLVVHKLTDPVKPKNEFLKPPAGKRWVSVDAEVTNNADSPQTVSSIACFDLRDSQNKKYAITITGESTSQLDGEIAPGDSLRGDLEFEVPKAAKGLKLSFKCDLLSSGSATIRLS